MALGSEHYLENEGKITETRIAINYAERRAHLELALKLKGHLVNRHEVAGTSHAGGAGCRGERSVAGI